MLKASVSSSQEWFPPLPRHHHQHPLIQCDIRHSPANCAALTGSKQHTHTHHLSRPSHSQRTVSVFRPIMPVSVSGPCGKGDIAKEGERARRLNEASRRLRSVCAHECADAQPAGPSVRNDPPFHHDLPRQSFPSSRSTSSGHPTPPLHHVASPNLCVYKSPLLPYDVNPGEQILGSGE